MLLGVVVVPPRLTGVRRRFGEEEVFAACALAVLLGDFLPVENGAVVAAGTGEEGGVVVVFVAAAGDPNCCRRLSRHAFARARASAAASFLDFLAGVAPPPSSSSLVATASAFRFLGGIVTTGAVHSALVLFKKFKGR